MNFKIGNKIVYDEKSLVVILEIFFKLLILKK